MVVRVSEGFLHKRHEFLAGSTIKERFSCKILVVEHESMQQKIAMSYFLPVSPKPFQRSPSYFPDPDTYLAKSGDL